MTDYCVLLQNNVRLLMTGCILPNRFLTAVVIYCFRMSGLFAAFSSSLTSLIFFQYSCY